MFSIERIVLHNFRLFAGTHVFEFPTEPGLYNLTGKNLTNPRLGANDCGKSTLLDAIYWCLYGRTTRGLRGGEIVSWGKESCRVGVTLNVGGDPAEIERHQNPNALIFHSSLGNKSHDQDIIDKYLRLPPEAFLCSVILPQFGEAFFDRSPSDKLALFSGIMELDCWLDRSKAASAREQELTDKINLSKQKLAKLEGQHLAVEEDLAGLIPKEQNFDASQSAIIVGMEADLQKLVAGAKANNEDYKYAAKGLLIAEEKLAKLAGKGTCPTCKQSIPNDDIKSINQNKSDFNHRMMQLKHQQHTNKRQQVDLQTSINKEVNRTNPYTQMIAEKTKVFGGLDKEIKGIKSQINSLSENQTAVSFWVSGFKRIRLFLVEEALRQLEIEVNNNLANLGLADWRIEFDVERENKSGGITKGFMVLIYPPGVEIPLRYESYGGGVTQRLRLAGDLGLANLIMERNGLSNTIEFYDEPSRHLSQEGLLDLAETLAQRAQDQRKIIFLVDHHVVDFSGFSDTFVISKGPRGSFL